MKIRYNILTTAPIGFTRRDDVLEVWEELQDSLENRRSRLEMNLSLQSFLRKMDDWKENSEEIIVRIASICKNDIFKLISSLNCSVYGYMRIATY